MAHVHGDDVKYFTASGDRDDHDDHDDHDARDRAVHSQPQARTGRACTARSQPQARTGRRQIGMGSGDLASSRASPARHRGGTLNPPAVHECFVGRVLRG